MPTKNKTFGKELLLTNSTIYIAPPRFESSVDSIIISNTSSATVTFSLEWYESSTSTYYKIANQVKMYPNSILQLTDGFILQPGDFIRGLSSVVSSITISIKVKEQFVTAL